MSTLADKLKQAKESLKTIATNVVEGNELTVKNEVFNQRMSCCQKCDKHIKITNQCGECNCFLAAKGRLAGMKCPLNKWSE